MATENSHEQQLDLVQTILNSLPPLKSVPLQQGSVSTAIPFEFGKRSADSVNPIMASHFENLQNQPTTQHSPGMIADHDIKVEPRNTAGDLLFPVTTMPSKQGLYYDTTGLGNSKLAQPQVTRPGTMNNPFPSLPSLPSHSRRYLRSGPEPAAGTPQANFKNLVLRPYGAGINTGDGSHPYVATGPHAPMMGSSAPLMANPCGGAPPQPNPPANRNRRRGAPDEQSHNPVQRLSTECQRRGFNPQWSITLTKDGSGYLGSVNIAGDVVQNDVVHLTAEKAKSACAAKALAVVTKLPLDKVYWQNRPEKIPTRDSYTPSYKHSYNNKVRMKAEYRERDYKPAHNGRGGVTSGSDTGEYGRLLETINAMIRPDTSVNKYFGARPAIVGAFFEGMALGTRMAGEHDHSRRNAEPSRDARREGSGAVESHHRHEFSTPDHFDSSPNHGESRGSARRHGGRGHDRWARRSSRSRSPRR